MTQIVALNDQTLLDVAIRHCGSMDALVDISILNNMSITENPKAGQIILLPTKDYGNQEVVNYFVLHKIEPATGINNEAMVFLTELGIGEMKIGTDFKVL